MHGIDDDARETGGVEHALLEVELPGTVLLRHQAPLQPVGEARDDALEVRELLVEIAAQAVELLGLTQLFRRHHFVEAADIRVVFRAARLVGAARG